MFPENIKCRVVQTGTKLSRNFNVKDKVDGKHLSNFIYRRPDCKNKKCDLGDYVRETSRRRILRTGEHGGKDKQSEIFKHSSTTKHPRVKDEDWRGPGDRVSGQTKKETLRSNVHPRSKACPQ